MERESTEKLDQVKDSEEVCFPLVAPVENLAPTGPYQVYIVLPLEPQDQQYELTLFPSFQRITRARREGDR